MKFEHLFQKLVFTITFASLSISINAQQQYDIMMNALHAGQEDANLFIKEFISPFGKALGSDLTSAWFNTAVPHETGGFDMTFKIHYAQIPSIAQTFNIDDLGMQYIKSTDGNNVFPTIFNSKETANANIFLVEDIPHFSESFEIKGFDAPSGAALPTFNIGMGILKNTEVMGRLIPSSSFGNMGNFNLWGLGVKHDILQWLTFVDDIPFDASLLFAFSKLKMDFGLDYNPTADVITVDTLPDDQRLKMNVASWNSNLIISKDIFFLTPYISAGITSSKQNFSMLGTYYYPVVINPNSGQTLIEEGDNYKMIDPVKITTDFGIHPQFVFGLRAKLMVLAIHAQYTIQEYNTFTFGFGISFR